MKCRKNRRAELPTNSREAKKLIQTNHERTEVEPKKMNKNGTPENLIPFDRMEPEQHKELSRRGGIRSGAVRREWKRRRELMRIMAEVIAEQWEAEEKQKTGRRARSSAAPQERAAQSGAKRRRR